MALYSKMGVLTIVPAADLASPTSAINKRTPARVGDGSAGKQAGMIVLVDNGGGDYDIAIATGSAPTDPWLVYGRESTVTPA